MKAENGILRRKLQSKTDGLMILSKEVEALRNELNQMKVLNEHLMNPVSFSKYLWKTSICLNIKTFLEKLRTAQ